MQGYRLGIACFVIGILVLIVWGVSVFVPGPPGMAYGALVAGLGTVVALIVLAVGLLSGGKG
jgi:hypothetical protein